MRRVCLLLVMALGSLAWAAGAQTDGGVSRPPSGVAGAGFSGLTEPGPS